MVLGLFARPVALVLALEMLVAFFQLHFPQGGAPIQNGGELPLLFMFTWLFFAGNGAGPASLDQRRARCTLALNSGPDRDASRLRDGRRLPVTLAQPARSSTRGRFSAISASRSMRRPAAHVAPVPDLRAEQEPDPAPVVPATGQMLLHQLTNRRAFEVPVAHEIAPGAGWSQRADLVLHDVHERGGEALLLPVQHLARQIALAEPALEVPQLLGPRTLSLTGTRAMNSAKRGSRNGERDSRL